MKTGIPKAGHRPRSRRPNGRLHELVHFKGIRRWSLRRYRDNVEQLYDGPRGALLVLSSKISLHEPMMGKVLRSGQFDVSRFRNVLDVGSGAGQIVRHVLNHTTNQTRLVAFDLSHQMLKRARVRLGDSRPNFISGDMMKMPFRDGSFDCITCGYVLEHLPEPRPGLQEFARVLSPGGSLLLLATEDTFYGAITTLTWKCRTYNRRELEATCRDVGLPWKEELWFSRFHRFMNMGGILVEATKPLAQGS